MSESYAPPGPSPLVTHREEQVRIEVLTRTDQLRGTLAGVAVGGSVEHNVNRQVRGGGSISVYEDDDAPWPLTVSGATLSMRDVDWYSDRIRVWWDVEGVEPWALGTFILSAPTEAYHDGYRGMEVSMMDKLSIPLQDLVTSTYSLAAGTVVTTAVRTLLESTGETNHAITNSDAVVGAQGLVWPAGTPKLRIINDLLDVIGYFSLFCDGLGQFQGQPYVRPEARPPSWTFEEGEVAIHLPEWQRDQDLFSVPNRFIGVSQGSGEVPALVSVYPATPAEEPYPDLPTSYARRGRWIAETEDGIEATTQDVLDSIVRQRLFDRSSAVANLTVTHAALPLELNDTVMFTSQGYGPALATVQGYTHDLGEGGLVSASWREVMTP